MVDGLAGALGIASVCVGHSESTLTRFCCFVVFSALKSMLTFLGGRSFTKTIGIACCGKSLPSQQTLWERSAGQRFTVKQCNLGQDKQDGGRVLDQLAHVHS